jgi:hypothetical protein
MSVLMSLLMYNIATLNPDLGFSTSGEPGC